MDPSLPGIIENLSGDHGDDENDFTSKDNERHDLMDK